MEKNQNKKIKNATPLEFEGTTFKSKLEVTTFKTLKEAGFEVYYEPTKYTIWEGIKPMVPFYTKDKKTGSLKLDNKKIISITYTPDFVVQYNNMVIVIEAKGALNDVYPYKRKLFRAYLEGLKEIYPKQTMLYFEVYSKRNILEAIQIIKDYDLATKNSGINQESS